MIELALNSIKKFYGATKILENVSFDIKTSEKVGLVGKNGTGKTTILKIIYGLEFQDEGVLSIKKGTTLGYLDQIPVFPVEYTVLEVLQSAFSDILNIEKDMTELENNMINLTSPLLETAVQKYGELQHSFELKGGYEIGEMMSKICTGLKITDTFKKQLFENLSGGEKTIVILARILLQRADIMLLDEPSNHLDFESIEWLEEYLRDFKGVALIVSHDRYFLDRVVSKIIELEDMEATTYNGNYSCYVETKENNLLLQFEDFKDQQKKIKAMEKTIKDLRDWGLRSGNNKFFRRAVSIEKRLDKMVRIEKPKTESDTMKINFLNTDRSGNDVIIIKNLCKGFSNKSLLESTNLLVRYGERTALIGKNGCGKSTLIKLLLGELPPDAGSAIFGSSIKVGYLPQNITFKNDEHTVLEAFREDIVLIEGKAREYLAKYMFYGESVFKKIKGLSGGERSRLRLAMLMYEEINLLILDEPTNHLDIESTEALEETLKNFKGTIFFISHDRYFINAIGTRVVELSDKRLIGYDGNYDFYRNKKISQNTTPNKVNFYDNTNINVFKKAQEQPSIIKQMPKLNEPDLKQIETLIDEGERELHEIHEKMLINSTDHNRLIELDEKKTLLQKHLDILINEWVSLQ